MPELPEVEHIRRALSAALVGRRVTEVVVRWAGALASDTPERFARALLGATLTSVLRRGKFLCFDFPPQTLLVHLRMTGRMLVFPSRCEELDADKHTHLLIEMAGPVLYYRDMRKFGRLLLTSDPASVLAGLGPEPLCLAFSAAVLTRRVQARHRQIKALLLDQHVVAGLGNIYVDESLWRAGLHPARYGDSLSRHEIERLHAAIQQTLQEAIAAGGTTIRDYRGAYGESGGYARSLAVYGREGKPCPRCGDAIERCVVAGRGTRVCPKCQIKPVIGASFAEA